MLDGLVIEPLKIHATIRGDDDHHRRKKLCELTIVGIECPNITTDMAHDRSFTPLK